MLTSLCVQIFPILAPLLKDSMYRDSLLAGLAASTGGLDRTLCQRAIDALVGVVEDGTGSSPLLFDIATTLNNLWYRHGRCAPNEI
jgi:Tubulin folding cofactor D C terminal